MDGFDRSRRTHEIIAIMGMQFITPGMAHFWPLSRGCKRCLKPIWQLKGSDLYALLEPLVRMKSTRQNSEQTCLISNFELE